MNDDRTNRGEGDAHGRGLLVPIVCAAAFVAGVLGTAATGGAGDPVLGAVHAFAALGESGWPAAVYLLAAHGLGRFVRPAFGASPRAGLIQLGVGLALMLSLSHGLGVLGWMTTPIAIAVCAVGCASSAEQGLRWMRRRLGERGWSSPELKAMPWVLFLCAPMLGVLVTAAACAPGSMWASEYGQYDSLSYHLQLPQEWWRTGRVWPVEHNVYSFLPGYVESAYVHLAALTAAPVDGDGGHGLLAGTGWRALAPHYLSVGLVVVTGLLAAGVVRSVADKGGIARTNGVDLAAGAAVLATPWVVVTGTISYNEMGVAALGMGAMLIAFDSSIRPAWRGVLCGGLVGVACGCKPTALFMVAPAVGFVLLGSAPVRTWWKLVPPGVVAGVVALSPWLVRNELAAGNPVFPAMAGVFGEGHWTHEQHERFGRAHVYEGSIVDRLRVFAWTNPEATSDDPLVVRFRGAANPQWGALFPIGLAGLVFGLGPKRTRRASVVLGLGLGAQVLAWLCLTHLQSRFLLPCVVTLVPMLGVGGLSRLNEGAGRWRGPALVALAACAQLAFTASILGKEGGPTGLGIEPSFRAGRPWVEASGELPSAMVSHALERGLLGDGARVALIAEATPFYYEKDVVYATTWDTWPMLAGGGSDPEAWTRSLRDRGVTHVVVNVAEFDRLFNDGWVDPSLDREAVASWLATLGEPEGAWPAFGVVLYELPGGGVTR